MVDFYYRLITNRITLEKAESKLIRFSGLLDMLKTILVHRESYKEKRFRS